jgi:hypothetical protein
MAAVTAISDTGVRPSRGGLLILLIVRLVRLVRLVRPVILDIHGHCADVVTPDPLQ